MTYDTREEYLNAFIDAARPHFDAANAPLPSNIRVSIGFTSRGAKSRAIAEIHSDTSSGDGHFEIFITPELLDVSRICDALTHELVHAAVGLKEGHGQHFRRVATSLGLTGKMTATVAGEAWYVWALPIIAELGEMPYAALTGEFSSAGPKKKTYLAKLQCPVCDWTARVTAKHIAPHSHLNCPVPGCDGTLLCEEG